MRAMICVVFVAFRASCDAFLSPSFRSSISASRPFKLNIVRMSIQSPPESPPESEALSAMELLAKGDSDPLVKSLGEEVKSITGAGLDSLMNPAKVINLEREILGLQGQLSELEQLEEDNKMTSEDEELMNEVRRLIDEKSAVSFREKRMVMKGWLRTVFRFQAAFCAVLSLLLVYDAVPFVGPQELYVRVLGYWSWWLFTIPSLRSIKPLSKQEKLALDIAFLATLVSSVSTPFFTKDLPTIWWVDAAVVSLSYAAGFTLSGQSSALESLLTEQEEEEAAAEAATWQEGGVKAPTMAGSFGDSLLRAVKFAGKALDVGAGRERGVRGEEATLLEKQLQQRLEQKAREKEAEK